MVMMPAFAAPTTLPALPTARIRNPWRTVCPRACATPRPPTHPPTLKPAVSFTPYENNTFILSTPSATLLIDPWLSGDLVFATPAFFRSRKPPPRAAALAYDALDLASVDAVVLTQGLADHAHPPTLARLPRALPVVCPPSAVPLLRSLGFRNILQLSFGQTVAPAPGADVTLTGLRGSVVGPPWSPPQLALVFRFGQGDAAATVYHEPHGNHDARALQQYVGRIDALIAPIVSTTIPILANYALVNGIPEALEVCRLTRPRTCVTFDNSGGEQTGFLTNYLKMEGGAERFIREVERDPALLDMAVLRTDTARQPVVIVPGHS